ncbi:hypothetical protein NIES4101_56210 [Calothrix sp. NIES-4101]|nr:hypothetical protein NIES4101_56210 [Calothrix sp. NIES-4101]
MQNEPPELLVIHAGIIQIFGGFKSAAEIYLVTRSSAVSDRLSHLQSHICENACTIIANCSSQDELDFLFPEFSRIRNHDLAVIETWEHQVDWMRLLPESELQLLNTFDAKNLELSETSDTQQTTSLTAPLEQLAYASLVKKSHFDSLQDQLLFMFQPSKRRQYEFYIQEKSSAAGYKILVTTNLQQASDMVVANLYHYFKNV